MRSKRRHLRNWLAVPTSSTLERTVLPHTVQGDNDFGDMFLNFQLHEDLQRYTGVDVSDLMHDQEAAGMIKETGFDWTNEIIYT
jgi:hypothetical protein